MLDGLKSFFVGTQTPEERAAQDQEEAAAQAAGLQLGTVEQPMLDPVDAMAGGLSAVPKGIANVLTDVGADLFLGLTMEANQNNDYLKSMYLGPKGIKALGIDASRDLVGQFSNVIDKKARLEVPDIQLNTTLNKKDDAWSSYKLTDVADIPEETAEAYTDILDVKFAPEADTGGYYDALENQIGVGVDNFDEPVSLARLREHQDNVLMHEGQHFVQTQENLGRGGTPTEDWGGLKQELYARGREFNSEADNILENLAYAYGSKREFLNSGHFLVDEYKALKSEGARLRDVAGKIKHKPITSEALEASNKRFTLAKEKFEEADRLGEMLSKSPAQGPQALKQWLKAKSDAAQLLEEARRADPILLMHKDGKANYSNLAGELESMDVERRRFMSPEDRRRTQPMSGFNPLLDDVETFVDPSRDVIPALDKDRLYYLLGLDNVDP